MHAGSILVCVYVQVFAIIWVCVCMHVWMDICFYQLPNIYIWSNIYSNIYVCVCVFFKQPYPCDYHYLLKCYYLWASRRWSKQAPWLNNWSFAVWALTAGFWLGDILYVGFGRAALEFWCYHFRENISSVAICCSVCVWVCAKCMNDKECLK